MSADETKPEGSAPSGEAAEARLEYRHAERGICWPNLIVRSVREAPGAGAPGWVFRIELDTLLNDAGEAGVLQVALGTRLPQERQRAAEFVIDRRGSNDDEAQAIRLLFSLPERAGTRSPCEEFAVSGIPLVEILEDYGAGAPWSCAARLILDVPLTGMDPAVVRGMSPDELRELLERRVESARAAAVVEAFLKD